MLQHEAREAGVRACGGGGRGSLLQRLGRHGHARQRAGAQVSCAAALPSAQKPLSVLQPVPSLELEALRLSLSNMHTVQLELTQANLQKEKETALTELRAMLNGRHAQELALLRSRQQQELELTRGQHAREREETVRRCSRETGTGLRAGRGLPHDLAATYRPLLLVLGRQAGPPSGACPTQISLPTHKCRARGALSVSWVGRCASCAVGLCCPLAFCPCVRWACVRF